MGCSENIEKYFLLVTNGFFLIFSLLLTFSGIWLLYDQNPLTASLGTLYDFRVIYPVVSIVVGILSTALHFLGLYGAYAGNSLLITLYSRFLIAVVILNSFYAVFNAESLDVTSVTQFKASFTNSNGDGYNPDEMNAIQYNFECCGYHGPEDVHSPEGYPWSCCATPIEECVAPLYKEGCLTKVRTVVTNIMIASLVVRVITILLHVVCIIAGCRMVGKIIKKLAATSKYEKITPSKA